MIINIMRFECEKCQKTFTNKRNLKYHIDKKVCENKNICTHCQKSFTHKKNLVYHQENKVCQKNEINTNNSNNNNNNSNSNNSNNSNNINIDNSVNPVMIFNFPCEFGKEDLDKILEKIPNLLKDSISKESAGIPYLIENIHCNPDFPEYNNVYIPNRKQNYALVSNGEQFVFKTKKKTIQELIDGKQDMLTKYVDKGGNALGEELLHKYRTYIEEPPEDDEQKELEDEITCLLLNMKRVIENSAQDKENLSKLRNSIEG